ncbi:hypothetical protein U1Q18_025289 [Sarracenia purpurea var. burkii]
MLSQRPSNSRGNSIARAERPLGARCQLLGGDRPARLGFERLEEGGVISHPGQEKLYSDLRIRQHLRSPSLRFGFDTQILSSSTPQIPLRFEFGGVNPSDLGWSITAMGHLTAVSSTVPRAQILHSDSECPQIKLDPSGYLDLRATGPNQQRRRTDLPATMSVTSWFPTSERERESWAI